jgi:hypothetical protein
VRKQRVEGLLESMGRLVVPVPDEPEVAREDVIEAINRKLELASSMRRASAKRGWLLAAAAGALCIALGVASVHFRAPPTAPVAASPSRGDVFKRGEALHTSAGETRTKTERA